MNRETRTAMKQIAGLTSELDTFSDELGLTGTELIALLNAAASEANEDAMHHALAFRQHAGAPLTKEQAAYLVQRLKAEAR
jgi:hypothetical protein